MAKTRRKKKRTHAVSEENTNGAKKNVKSSSTNVPKTFVVKRGKLSHLVKSLTEDVRKIMEPNTASKLKDSKSNKLKDFINVAVASSSTETAALSRPQ